MPSNVSLTGKPQKLLRMLFENGKIGLSCIIDVKQSELAKQLDITRQALNVHLRRLRSLNLIRTGRGFLAITDEGLKVLGLSKNPAFIFVKVSPQKRVEAYKKIVSLPVRQSFRVAGEMDIVVTVESQRLENILESIAQIDGIEDTRSYIAIESLK